MFIVTNYKKFISFFLIIALSFIRLIANAQEGPRINIPSTLWEIGTIKLGDEVTRTFKIMNLGTDELKINNIRSSCSCLTVKLTSKVVKPKEYTEIIATFKEESKIGDVIKTIYIDSNDISEPRKVIKVMATIIQNGSKPAQKFQIPKETFSPKVMQNKDTSVCITLFGSDDCEDCTFIKDYINTNISKKFGKVIKLKFLSIDNVDNYDLLVKLEEQYSSEGNDIPVIFIGNNVLGGKEEIIKNLEVLIEKYISQGGASFPEILETDINIKTSESVKPIHIAFFERAGCKSCDRVNFILKRLESSYPTLNIRRFNVEDKNDIELFESLCSLYDVPENKRLIAPSIFIGKHYLIDKQITDKELRKLITEYEKGTEEPWKSAENIRSNAKEKLIDRFKSLGVFTILSAGFIDGINPCAFATIILFISYLVVTKRKKHEIIYVGLAFSLAVFLTYLLVGIGIFRFIQALSVFTIFSSIIYLLIAFIALILGILSLYDFIKVRKGNPQDMLLQLPDFFKNRIHSTIRNKSRADKYIIYAFITGVIVSIFELACTGQVYLPTILFVTGIPELSKNASVYLFLYNLMFILPLVIIFILAYFGTTHIALINFMQRHSALVKILTSVLFFVLFGLLLFNFFPY